MPGAACSEVLVSNTPTLVGSIFPQSAPAYVPHFAGCVIRVLGSSNPSHRYQIQSYRQLAHELQLGFGLAPFTATEPRKALLSILA